VAPTGCLLGVAAALRRFGYAPVLADIPGRASGWPLAAAVAGGVGVLLFWTATARIDDTTHNASGGQDLLTVLHYRTPIAVGVAVILVIVAVGGALMIGRTGDDERILDRAAEQRRLREQRAHMRREHRAAARALRSGSDGGVRR
jgi:type IV secretory pathway VirB2 component (pilin)